MCSDINIFITKIVETLRSFIPNCDIVPEQDQLKIVGDCIYCGRSKRGLPHLGIIIQVYDENRITGAINCFRCGTSKTLRRFLFDIKDVLTYYKIKWEEVEKRVISVEREKKRLDYDFNFSSSKLEMEQSSFMEMLRQKYQGNPKNLKRAAFLNLNAFQFIKKRLKLNHQTTIFTAYDVLREVRSKCTFNDGRFYLSFGGVVDYIFTPDIPEKIILKSDMDVSMYGESSFNFILGKYIKKKNHIEENSGYYIIKDSNVIDGEPDTLNIYVAEGVFDTLTMKYYKNFFNLSNIGTIQHNIVNTYVAVCHYKINTFVSKTLRELISGTAKISESINNINFVLVPDLNMNPRKYVTRLYKSIEKDKYDISKILGGKRKISAYYLDVFNSSVAGKVKDVNDIINNSKKKNLKNVGLIEIF